MKKKLTRKKMRKEELYNLKVEKKFFSSSSKNIQLVICKIWIILLKILYTLKGRSFKKIVSNYFMKNIVIN